jgi:hypothetical protein
LGHDRAWAVKKQLIWALLTDRLVLTITHVGIDIDRSAGTSFRLKELKNMVEALLTFLFTNMNGRLPDRFPRPTPRSRLMTADQLLSRRKPTPAFEEHCLFGHRRDVAGPRASAGCCVQ